ncbi:MAG: hypothetical protein AB1351_13215 [Thermoproteota archaeon]
MKVDPDKLSFELFTTSDNFSALDFTEEDGTDPLGIDDFIKNKFSDYLQNNLTSIWTVRYEGHIVAYFLQRQCLQFKQDSCSMMNT